MLSCNDPLPNKTIFVTGAAGFIGHHLSKRLLDQGCKVIGIDNLNERPSLIRRQKALAS